MPDEGDIPVREFIAALPLETILSVESPLIGQSFPADPVLAAKNFLASARRVSGESA
jgi:hypothetical protein